MPKKATVSQLHKKLWKLVSEYTRRLGSVDGMNFCYTCGNPSHWKDLQAGHFLSRRHKATLYFCDNLRPQCVSCNIFRSGEQFIFGEKLRKEIGDERFEALLRMQHEIKQFKVSDLEEMIEEYGLLLKGLEDS